MPARDDSRAPTVPRTTVALSALVLIAATCFPAQAQDFSTTRAVGGVSIAADGILDNASVDAVGKLRRIRAAALAAVPAELHQATGLRKISLRRLEAAIAGAADDEHLPDDVKHLAGLQQIRYVLVYPQRQDIVLAGPAEGWKVGPNGSIVGLTSGRPVMLLDDLLIALRTARSAARTGISCSIDPTAEGLTRLRSYVGKLRTIGPDPQATVASIEQTLGRQTISVTGVPPTSHFARVMVAADYRMKRMAMHFEPAPVGGLPSFLQMMKATGTGMKSMLPRWWLAPDYEPLLRDADGLAWELPEAAVKTMTEEDFLTAAGTRRHTGRPSLVAQRWAENMTGKYDQLAVADPIFGQLRNCMELAVVAALIVKEDLTAKAGYSMPGFLDPGRMDVVEFPAPKQVDSKASVLKKGRKWLISASGGVQINSWAAADNVRQSDALSDVRTKAVADNTENWWWN